MPYRARHGGRTLGLWPGVIGFDRSSWRGDELRRRREQACLTTHQLGVLMGCSGSLIQRFESGRQLPHPYDVTVLAVLFECSVRAFLRGPIERKPLRAHLGFDLDESATSCPGEERTPEGSEVCHV